MSVFESNMLLKYLKKYNCKPTSWLRFIDFFIWNRDKKSLKHFLNFCNNYSKSEGMQSTIKFTYSYSTLTVNLLDVTVKVENNGTLSTTLFAKPTASNQYLHAKSSHPFHTMKALPKSQFITIRRICTFTTDYWKHANIFINFFMRRGYKKPGLIKIATEISKINRSTLLEYKHREKSEHIPLELTWHHQIQNISRVICSSYSTVAKKFPEFKTVFKETPPILAYIRPKSLLTLSKWIYTKRK